MSKHYTPRWLGSSVLYELRQIAIDYFYSFKNDWFATLSKTIFYVGIVGLVCFAAWAILYGVNEGLLPNPMYQNIRIYTP